MTEVEKEVQERHELRETYYKELSAWANERISRLYDSIDARIEREIRLSRESGKYHTKKEQKRLMAEVRHILDEFEEGIEEIIWLNALKVGVQSVNEANEDIAKDDNWKAFVVFDENPKGFDHKQFIDNYIEDQMRYVTGQTGRMESQLRQHLREEGIRVFRKATMEGLSHTEAARQLAGRLESLNPGFTFQDRAGRRWNAKAYFEMLSVTILNNVRREAYVNETIEAGYDLVRVTTVPTKDECRNWIGKILSLTGSTSGYPTYDEAKASKEVFHPRCRHSVYAYHGEVLPDEE